MDVEVASNPQPSLLLALPVETVVHILEFCDYEDLATCTMTCKLMKEAIAHHDSLQYILALACAGLTEDASDLNSGIPLSTKLARVREYLNVGSRGGSLVMTAQLKTNMFVECRYLNGRYILRAPFVHNMRFTAHRGARRSVLKRIQSDWPEGRTLDRNLDYVIDFKQDLVVGYPSFMAPENEGVYSLLFLSLSTGLPHPLAICGSAALEIPTRFRGYGMNEVYIRGRHLSFFRFRNDAVAHPSGALDYDRVHEVMNWHSGETIAVIPSFDPPGRDYWDGHGLMIAQSTYIRAVTRGRDPRSRQQRPSLQMMPIPLPWDPATYVESIGSSPRFGLNQMQRLPTMTGIELRLPDLDERWRLSLRAGPRLDIPSFSLQGLPSDSNDLMMFHYSAQLAAQHESPEGVQQTDIFLFVDVLELLREVTYSLQPVLRPAALTEVPWPDWMHCARLVVPPHISHPGLSWRPASWSSAMRAGFYIHHDISIQPQPPLPEMLWGTRDYLNAVYVIDFHPRRARFTRQNTTWVSAPVLLGPVNTAQSIPIFIDRDMSLGGLACTEFVLSLPPEVASMRSRLLFGMTEDGVILYGHAGHAHDDGHIQVLASVLPQSNEWGIVSVNPQLSLLTQHS